jgi:hypothetical protein
MAQQTPVRPPQPRPKIIRTPYGWDCKMEDEASVIPAWQEPPESGGRRRMMAWALVPLAIAVIAALVWHPPFLAGPTSAPVVTRSPAPRVATKPAATPASPSPSVTPAPTATPVPTPAPTPVPAAPPSTPAPSAPPASSAPTTATVTGTLGAGVAGAAACDNNGARSSNPPQCQWGVTAAAGSTVNYTVTWTPGAPLMLQVYGPAPAPGQHAALLATVKGATGSLSVAVPNTPTETVVIVSGGAGAAAFNLEIALNQ